MFKHLSMIILLALGTTLVGCGNSKSGNINGTWNATLTNPDASPAFAFQTTFTGATGGVFTVSSFTFTTSGACFASAQTTESGSVSLSGNYNGNVSGSFGMTITTVSMATNNVLTLNGTVTGGTITGTWTLTGASGCNGNGAFTATKS